MYADYPNIALILCAAALGIMLFFSALVAPGIFKHLPIEWAAVYVRQFFPKYYAFLAFTTALASMFLVDSLLLTLVIACSGLFFYSWLILTPQVNRAKDAGRHKAFHYLHLLSVAINFLNMIALIIVVWRLA